MTRVTQLDQVFRLHIEHFPANVFRLFFGRERDFHEIGHCVYSLLLQP
jgi:hypothetical protein